MQDASKNKLIEKLVFWLGIGVVLIIYVLKIHEIIVRADYQWEVREGVGIYMAQRFAEGINPYVYRDGLPEAVYMYGFLMPALLSVFIKLGIPNIILFAQFLTLGVEIIGVSLFGLIIKRNSVNNLMIPIGMIGASSCYYRVAAYGGVFPDVYGLTMLILIWFLVQADERRNRFHIITYAVLCTLCFYIKQYFVFVSVGFLLYFALKKAYKELLSFSLIGLAIGGGSILLVRFVFPTYFTTNSYFLSVYNAYSIGLAIEQLAGICKLYPVLCISIVVGLITVAFGYRYEKISMNMYAVSQAIVMLLIGFFLSTSNGAWLTYYLQLLVPYIICLALVFLTEWVEKLKLSQSVACGIVVILFCVTLFGVRKLVIIKPINNDQISQWEEVYEILDNYKDGDIKVSALPLNFYCLKNGIYNDNPGHSNCYTYELLNMISEDKPSGLIYPYSEELVEQYMEYHRDSLEKCENGYYDCVVVEKNNYFREEIEEAVSDLYMRVNDYTLLCGEEKWECTVYARK